MQHDCKQLDHAVRIALGLTMGMGLTATATPLIAQDEDTADLDRVQVTGSRISRTDIEGATPVTVIDRQDIELSGFENIADLLRSTTFNSFGSFRERSGTTFGQVALVDLRGIGSQRTAVLINGRRQPGSPFTGAASANLNSIPINAIERIEILTDSASAVYGTDAIGGVINIILRDDYEGAELSAFVSRPSRSGGDELSGSMTIGGSSDRGNYVFSAEWFERDPIFDRDRPYSQAQFNPGDRLGVDTVGVNEFGNTAFIVGGDLAGSYRAVGPCSEESGFAGVFDFPPVEGDTACGFAYADVSAQTGGIKRLASFLSANYEITPDHNLYYQGVVTRMKSFGRYAPAAGLFFIEGDNPENPFGEPFYLLHRFIAHGPRDDDTKSYEFDNVLGLEGRLGQIDYDYYIRSFKAESIDFGTGYVLASVITDLVDQGLYNFNDPTHPDNASAVAQSAHTITRDLRNDTWQSGLTFSGFAGDLMAGPIGWAAGLEYSDTRYRDIFDSAREANNVLGSAGNTAAGDRDRWAAFAEVLVPLMDDLELTLAGRYDDYSDFGDQFSPQVALRYQPMESLLLRGSWGKGFRAPSLIELFQVPAPSNNNVVDLLLCQEQGIPADDCPNRQVLNFSGGNPDLEAEESESWNFGVVWEPINNLSLGGDIYRIELEDAIQQIGLSTLLALELEGQPLPPGTAINRDPNTGIIQNIQTGAANVAKFTVEGWDLKANHTLNAGDTGVFETKVEYSRIKTFDFTSDPTGDPTNLAKRFGSPSHRANLNLRWTMSDFTVNYTGRWISSTFNRQGPDSDNPDHSSFIQHDLVGSYHTPWDGEIQVGVRNLANKLPPIEPVNGWLGNNLGELGLYPVEGRVPFISYSQRL